jgi:hypothetical protein
MKRLKYSLIPFCFFAHNLSHAWIVEEIYYSLNKETVYPLTLSNNPIVNNGDGVVFPASGKGFFMANNLVRAGSGFVAVTPNYWSGITWTGINPSDRSGNSQKGVANFGTLPSYGQSLVQVNSSEVGMHLNTWGLQTPNPYPTSSLQFKSLFSPGKQPWLNSGSQLCVNSSIDLHSWYGAASSNIQFMFTLQFRKIDDESRYFYINALMLDTDGKKVGLKPIPDTSEKNGTGAPILITYVQTNTLPQDPDIKYSSTIPGFGQVLTGFSSDKSKPTSSASNAKPYGFCISNAQFSTMLSDISFPGVPSSYKLEMALVSPEIKGYANAGLSIKAFNVYKINP